MSSKPWWHPDALAKRRPALAMRGRVLAALRGYFAEQGFAEVETPCLQSAPGTEPHITALATELKDPLGGTRRLYLHSSPEFAMKKLMVGGVERLYQVAHVWRDGERSPVHHPEFTLLEWYRAHQGYETLMEDCAALLRLAAAAAGTGELRYRQRRCDPARTAERLSVAAAFARHCGIDLLATAPDPLAPDPALLAAEARRIGLFVSERDSWEDVFFRIMLERIEPHLGDGAATFLYEYPLSMA
ncbi:MAG: amino acid--tRNA ligase-related protein, partial [Alphaproteobacteria bacterium]